MSPEIDPYSPVGFSGGDLTMILITYECAYVLLCDKEEYLKGE
jgi:hypothetical protein